MLKPEKPVTIKVFEKKERQTRDDFANMLETIAKKLREDGQFIIVDNETEYTIEPSNDLKVELSYERKADKHSFEIEFDWYDGDKNSQKLVIK